MRRPKLVWFAVGAATAGLSSIVAGWLFEPVVFDESGVPYLILTDRTSPAPSSAAKGADGQVAIANAAGETLKNCGARVFEMVSHRDRAPTAELPIVRENYDAIKCVIRESRNKNIEIEAKEHWSSPATNELRSKTNAQTH